MNMEGFISIISRERHTCGGTNLCRCKTIYLEGIKESFSKEILD
jgi:hypothetical protein